MTIINEKQIRNHKRIAELVYVIFEKKKEGKELLKLLQEEYLLNLGKQPSAGVDMSYVWQRLGENRLILAIPDIINKFKYRTDEITSEVQITQTDPQPKDTRSLSHGRDTQHPTKPANKLKRSNP